MQHYRLQAPVELSQRTYLTFFYVGGKSKHFMEGFTILKIVIYYIQIIVYVQYCILRMYLKVTVMMRGTRLNWGLPDRRFLRGGGGRAPALERLPNLSLEVSQKPRKTESLQRFLEH